MILLASVKSIQQIEKIKSYANGFVFGYSKWTAYSSLKVNYDELKKLSLDYDCYLLVNVLIHQYEIKDFENDVLELAKLKINFIVADLGALNIFIKHNLSSRVIYQPETMITNYMDALTYDADNLLGVGISNEITLDDAKIITDYINNAFYLGFGYHPMYRSYRKILSLYKKHSQIDYSFSNLTLKEDTREDHYPVIENEYESVVFRGGVISVLKEIEKLKFVKFLFLDNIFIDEEKFNNLVEIYSSVINKNITKEEGLNRIQELDIKEDNCFMDKDSHYEVD